MLVAPAPPLELSGKVSREQSGKMSVSPSLGALVSGAVNSGFDLVNLSRVRLL